MYSENLIKDILLFFNASLSNQLARFAPILYVNLTHQTGRAHEAESPESIAAYFLTCFKDYQAQLEFSDEEFSVYLTEKKVLEYGPGDILAIPLLMYAHGAASIDCFDKFPLSKLSNKNIEVYNHLLLALGQKQRDRANTAFVEWGKPESGMNPNKINYRVTPRGLTEKNHSYDLIISRAVLEHVDDLEGTLTDIKKNLKIGGVSIHQIDLKSHGLDRYVLFDFLTWPTPIYNFMYSHKGFPNRWRINKYRELISSTNLSIKKLLPTNCAEISKMELIKPKVSKEFEDITNEELSWLGFWMILEQK